jgi:hypothetical protein
MIPRRDLIILYVHYDARKKGRPVPVDIDSWNWSSADALDENLRANRLKNGIVAGYTKWRPIELRRHELARCALVSGILPPTLPRVLGSLKLHEIEQWSPDRSTEWYAPLERGEPYPRDWPLILRPAVVAERPAEWYVEDGSGRALCLYRRLVRNPADKATAPGFLGAIPDPSRTFMRNRFPQLLQQRSR